MNKQYNILETFEKEWFSLNGKDNNKIIVDEVTKEQQSRMVLVKNISEKATIEDLFDIFSTHGTVLLVTLKPGTPSSEAQIEYDQPEAIEKAVQLTGFELHQKPLIVHKLSDTLPKKKQFY